MVHCLYDLIRPGTEGSGKREKRESARTPARVREREKKRESARARARSFLGLDAHVQEGRHMHTGSHMHRAGLGTVGARLCRADDTGGWTRWRPPAPRPAAHCSRTPSGADLFAVCRPNPQRSAGRPLRGRRGRAHDAGICTPRPRGSGGADGPHPARYRLSFSPRLAQTVHVLAQCAWPRVDRQRASTPPLTAGHLNTGDALAG